ncbi:MAG: hypothetical protein F4X07_07915 [Acidimicrobiaceae bacterium]|nr:hypothetical protein [Acidimicrobiaceae bacterium]
MNDETYKLPDFTFVTDADERIIWEHLEMLDLVHYADGWRRKRSWYEEQGYVEGETLFTTHERGGLDSALIEETIDRVRTAIATE